MKQCDLKTARERAGFDSQQALSDKSGVSISTISRIEAGIIVDPSNSTVARLEQALRLKRGTLVFGEAAVALGKAS